MHPLQLSSYQNTLYLQVIICVKPQYTQSSIGPIKHRPACIHSCVGVQQRCAPHSDDGEGALLALLCACSPLESGGRMCTRKAVVSIGHSSCTWCTLELAATAGKQRHCPSDCACPPEIDSITHDCIDTPTRNHRGSLQEGTQYIAR